LKGPLGWGTASMVAASLGCSTRWITQLCRMGQLAAVKVGRSWSIDPDSVQDFKQRGANAA
jgi:excisionase family DNA binding protein